jgi:hypothetical protein
VEGRTLYYAERDVRAFLGGLAMTRLMLLQGISGTGKTSLPLAFASAVGGGIEIVEVQAGWRDRQDLVGYYNAFHRHYYATNFLQALYSAGTPAYRDRLFLMVLDEINLSRPEQFFADFLSALEQPMEERRLTLVNDPVDQRAAPDGRRAPPADPAERVVHRHRQPRREHRRVRGQDLRPRPRDGDAAQDRGGPLHGGHRGTRAADLLQALMEAFEAAANRQADDRGSTRTTWLRKASFADDLQQRSGSAGATGSSTSSPLPAGRRRVRRLHRRGDGPPARHQGPAQAEGPPRRARRRHSKSSPRASSMDDWEASTANLPERCVALIEREIAAKKGEELE